MGHLNTASVQLRFGMFTVLNFTALLESPLDTAMHIPSRPPLL